MGLSYRFQYKGRFQSKSQYFPLPVYLSSPLKDSLGIGYRRLGLTRSSADAGKPARRLYTGYGFLLVFYRNFVRNTHRF